MKLSDYVANFLFERKVRHIFGYTGGSVSHLIDSIHKVDGLAYIQNYHEQASSFSADAYARACGGIGVAIATSGPGATNLITGIANAFFDSVPCLFITGQVSTHAIKKKSAIRQESFQETDIVPIVRPITKFAETILQPEKIRFYLEKAITIAQSGRPGAVLLDIPHNLQASEIDPSGLQSYFHSDEYAPEVANENSPDQSTIRHVVSLLTAARRPVVLVGGGMASVRGSGLLKTFADACDVPVVSSLMGLDALDHNDRHFCGFVGSYGNRYANFAVATSDFLLVLGSRLDERQTGTDRSLFATRARIVHVDIDPDELNHHVREDVSICCDIRSFLNAFLVELGSRKLSNERWLECIRQWKKKYPSHTSAAQAVDVNPNEFAHVLSKKVSANAMVCLDVGQNQMWIAQSFCLSENKQLLSSSGHGAMGYSLPAGIGAYYASSGRQIICVMGDGGLQMNLQELQTVSRDNIPIKICVMNNQSLGMIRDFHEHYFDNNCYGSAEGYTNPDFEKIAYAFNLPYTRIRSRDDFDTLDSGLKTGSPHFFEVILSPTSRVTPGPAPRRPVEDQLPLLDRDELSRILELRDCEWPDGKI